MDAKANCGAKSLEAATPADAQRIRKSVHDFSKAYLRFIVRIHEAARAECTTAHTAPLGEIIGRIRSRTISTLLSDGIQGELARAVVELPPRLVRHLITRMNEFSGDARDSVANNRRGAEVAFSITMSCGRCLAPDHVCSLINSQALLGVGIDPFSESGELVDCCLALSRH